eukprot:scaffold4781_cov102-Isochrysis_galbana.AAC.3
MSWEGLVPDRSGSEPACPTEEGAGGCGRPGASAGVGWGATTGGCSRRRMPDIVHRARRWRCGAPAGADGTHTEWSRELAHVFELELIDRVIIPRLAKRLPVADIDGPRPQHRPHDHLHRASVGSRHDAHQVAVWQPEDGLGLLAARLELGLADGGTVATPEGRVLHCLERPAWPLRARARAEAGAGRPVGRLRRHRVSIAGDRHADAANIGVSLLQLPPHTSLPPPTSRAAKDTELYFYTCGLLNARTRSGKHKQIDGTMELCHPSSPLCAHTYPRTSAHPCLREHVLHVGVNRRAEARDDLDARQQIEPAVEGKQRASGKTEGVGATSGPP